LGCAVGVSMLALFAMIAFDGLEELDDGSSSNPDIEVLSEDVLRRPVPWLRGGEEGWVGKNGEPITVRTALFFGSGSI